MVYKTHLTSKIDSRLRNNGEINNFEIFLTKNFTFKDVESRRYYMRFEDVDIPLSYYNVNSNFNVLRVIETDGVTSPVVVVTLDVGNYTAAEIEQAVQLALNNGTNFTNVYTVTYDPTNNKFDFKVVFGTGTASTIDTIANGSTLNEIMGVGTADTAFITTNDNTLSFVNNTNVTAPFSVKLDPIQYIHIIIRNLTSNNSYIGGKPVKIGAFIPTSSSDRNGRLYYENNKRTNVQLNSKHTLNHLEVELRDNYDNLLDLNGHDYNFNLIIEELVDFKKSETVHNLN